MKMCFTVSYCIFGEFVAVQCSAVQCSAVLVVQWRAEQCSGPSAGMTLLSMCMNLMQEQIVEKVM